MKRYLLYSILFGAVLLGSCIDEYNATLPDSTQEMLVVEGSIISDSTVVIHLTHTIGLDGEAEQSGIPVVTLAQVVVKGDDGSLYAGNETDKGTYSIKIGHLNPDAHYWMVISTPDGLQYESEPASPLDAPPFTLSYEQLDDDNSPVDIYVSAEGAGEPQYLSWNFNETYELQTPCSSLFYYDHEQQVIDSLESPIDHGYGMRANSENIMACSDDYVENRINGLRLTSIPKSSPRISKCYRIMAYQEAISKAEYEYEEARRKQSDEMGGIFTPQPSQLPTNIHCTNGDKGIIGFIGVRGRVTTQVMYLRTPQDVHYAEKRKMRILMPDDISAYGYTLENFYWEGLQVWEYDEMTGSSTWVSSWAVDVRIGSWGFTTFKKPDYWEPPY